MVSIRCDRRVPLPLAKHLRRPILRALSRLPDPSCDVYIYAVGPADELMVRVTLGQAVIPILFHSGELEAGRVYAVVKGALARAEF